jgi:hypothetical protein
MTEMCRRSALNVLALDIHQLASYRPEQPPSQSSGGVFIADGISNDSFMIQIVILHEFVGSAKTGMRTGHRIKIDDSSIESDGGSISSFILGRKIRTRTFSVVENGLSISRFTHPMSTSIEARIIELHLRYCPQRKIAALFTIDHSRIT